MTPPSSPCGVGSVVEEDWEEGDSVEADGVMEIVTECWVEPQNGVVVSPSPRAHHLNNCSYRQLAQAVSTLVVCPLVVCACLGPIGLVNKLLEVFIYLFIYFCDLQTYGRFV